MSEPFGNSEQLDLESIEKRLDAIARPGSWTVSMPTMAEVDRLNLLLKLARLVKKDAPALIQRVRALEAKLLLFEQCLHRAEVDWAERHPDEDIFPDGANVLVRYIESLEPDAKLGRALRGIKVFEHFGKVPPLPGWRENFVFYSIDDSGEGSLRQGQTAEAALGIPCRGAEEGGEG